MAFSIPIHVNHLFAPLDEKLVDLLHSLEPAEWTKQTIAKKWQVRDIAAHLLDTTLRGISLMRDGYMHSPAKSITGYEDLVAYLNGLNANWVKAMSRLSTRLLTDLLEQTGKEFTQAIIALPPEATAAFSVSWAGEEESKNWFHVAREYTEKWIHQQQIRDAVDRPGIFSPDLFFPVMDTFMRALPYTYRNTAAPTGTAVQLEISGIPKGKWAIQKKPNGWELMEAMPAVPAACVSINPDTAWKLFSKGMSPVQAQEKVLMTGDKALAEPALNMVSVMA